MVSKARLDLPDPESPVMQMRAFRGSRTVMSLRLCSRAPWTISSSAAIEPHSTSRTYVRTGPFDTHRMEARARDLRIVAAAIAVSSIGDWVAVLTLALRTEERWHGIGVSILLIALWSPVALLSGHVGLLVDRLETRGVAIAAALAQGAIAVALAFSTGSIPAILVLTVLLGAGAAVGQSAEFALVPLLAGRRSIAQAIGLADSARSDGSLIGPLISGALAARARRRPALPAAAAASGPT